jgi:uncharacterized RDD family membrane protein YckC
MLNNVLLRRFFTVGIDSLYFLPGAIFFALFDDLVVISLIIMFTTFVLRDAISERSFGKRVMELCIIDKNTGKSASIKQRIIRNLFFIIGSIDVFVLLIKGESIGDKVSNTIVIKS